MDLAIRLFIDPHHGATYDDVLRVARCAEDAGYDAIFRSDHYLRLIPGDGLPGPADAWLTLAGLAWDTSTIRLPGPLAIAVAQVDRMSGGRVELGLGTGWFEAEHRAQVLCVGRTDAELARRADAIGKPVDELRATGLAGSPAEVADRLGRWRARTGVARVYLEVLDLHDLDHVELVAAAVFPQL